MSENGSGEQPDGSVGRYVRERWGSADTAGRSFGRRRRAGGDDGAQPGPDAAGAPATDGPEVAEPRRPSAAERAASAPAPGRAAVGTQTPPAGSAWGSELPEVDDDLVDEIDPHTPPHGLDLSALHAGRRGDAQDPEPHGRPDEGRHHAAGPDYATHDHGPDDTGIYRSGGGGDPEPWWTVPGPAGPADDDPDGGLIWRRPEPLPDDDTTPATGTPVREPAGAAQPSAEEPAAGYPDDAHPQDRSAIEAHAGDGAPGAAGPWAEDTRPATPGTRPDGPVRDTADVPAGARAEPEADTRADETVRESWAVPGPAAEVGGPVDARAHEEATRDAARPGEATRPWPADAAPDAAAEEPATGARPGAHDGAAHGGIAHDAPAHDTAAHDATAHDEIAPDGDAHDEAARATTARSSAAPGAEPGPARDAAGSREAARADDDARARGESGERPWRSAWDDDAAERGARSRSRPAPESGARRPRWTAPEAVEARAAQHRRGDEPHGGLDLAPTRTAHSSRRVPTSGWRRLVYLLTGGLVNPGESPAELYQRELVSRLNRPLINSHKIAMLSLKGGVGKTTVTATLGATFASHRGDRVVAVDANPDRGTLSQKIPLETTATVRHLLRDAVRVRRYSDVRAYTSQGRSRLEVLASEQDPAVSEAFSEDDYRRAVDLLEHFYNLVLTDCGTGLMHSAMYGVLGMADQIVIVSSGSIDGARSASATLDWLDAHGYGSLVRNAVVVINSVYRRAGGGVDLDRVAEHFAGRCRAVVRVPFDPHLEEGAEIDLDRLEGPTRTALLELAAAVADGFPV
ncbi:MinD-like ATPase involved in chromosome partitioning or flagellar assembly [Pseudonocardia ammonioxydans]|uniref:MinD-like ATPase involved in chromosome partitioning or flagellar assembly n=1 Tax=Pseudonocardia ammonioxydans TaxID=260086 RepID=A0A1I4RZU7_PSUAM|nr:MinD-like ATPase involved in chromosome partitioning or flagellar assembly [Pseudonocardia ammonioxydans]